MCHTPSGWRPWTRTCCCCPAWRLFACDALAERLQVSRQRRVVLSVVEAALLWNVVVWWGHPEDAVAVAFAVYALIFALDKRFVGAGWLFGAAVAFQPLVLLMLPVLLAMAGRRSGPGMAVRSLVPTAALLLVPLIANFRVTLHTLVDQPSSPNFDHATPWTALSPNLGGQGQLLKVAAGPVRILAVAAGRRARSLGVQAVAQTPGAIGVGVRSGPCPPFVHGIGDDGLLRMGGLGCRGGRGRPVQPRSIRKPQSFWHWPRRFSLSGNSAGSRGGRFR